MIKIAWKQDQGQFLYQPRSISLSTDIKKLARKLEKKHNKNIKNKVPWFSHQFFHEVFIETNLKSKRNTIQQYKRSFLQRVIVSLFV